jgi:hypothetical protein
MTGPTLAELDWGRGLSPPFGDRSDEHRGAAPSDERLSLDRSLSNDSLVRPGASSRLNNKASDAIILVQQRLHLDDLAGHVEGLEDWVTLRLPAIAEEYGTMIRSIASASSSRGILNGVAGWRNRLG